MWQVPEANEWFQQVVAAFGTGRPVPVPPAGRPGPFAFAEPERVHDVLGAAGFEDVDVRPQAEPMWFGSDPDDAVALIHGVAGWMLEGLDAAARARAVALLRRAVEAHRSDDGVEFGSATWLVTARRAA